MKTLIGFLITAILVMAQPVTQIGTGNVSTALYFGGLSGGGSITGSAGSLMLNALGPNGKIIIPATSGTTGFQLLIGTSTELPAFGSGISIVRDGTEAVIQLQDFDSSSATGPGLITMRARGTLASPVSLNQDDAIFNTSFRGYYGGGTPGFSAASRGDINVFTGEAWSDSTHNGTYLRVRTTPNATATTQESLRLTSTTTTSVMTGGALNMIIVSGTGPSRTMTLQTTTSGSAATNAEIINATQQFRWPAYGAGALTTDGSGNITAVSDARLKDIQGEYTAGLAEILKVHPKLFRWNKQSGYDQNDLNAGLIAQDLLAAGLANAVATERTEDVYEDKIEPTEEPIDNPFGPSLTIHGQKTVRYYTLTSTGENLKRRVPAKFYTVNDRTLIAALINAVKELNTKNTSLEDRLAKLEAK